MKTLTGQCLCGKIAYEINGKLGTVANCHCSKCRRWHGAAFRTRASVRRSDFKWLRGEECLSYYESSAPTIKTFCTVCGSSLISLLKHDPEYIGLPIGGLDQDPDARPQMHIFAGSKAPWYEITDDLPQYETWPPGGSQQVRVSQPSSQMAPLTINVDLVQELIVQQFPQWKHLPIRPVAVSGWDNRNFHLGDKLSIRLPSSEAYACQVAKEQHWLPRLAPLLPYAVPTPVARGTPTEDYPFPWSVYRWLPGTRASHSNIHSLSDFAKALAKFITELQAIDPTDGPLPGNHNFYRGGDLHVYDVETRTAIDALKNNLDTTAAINLWETALASCWQQQPVWLHGDISCDNLLVQHGRLAAVIDFGLLAIGDPACDLAIAWTFFSTESRAVFRRHLTLDEATWSRARAWALWKALITVTQNKPIQAEKAWRVIKELVP